MITLVQPTNYNKLAELSLVDTLKKNVKKDHNLEPVFAINLSQKRCVSFSVDLV